LYAMMEAGLRQKGKACVWHESRLGELFADPWHRQVGELHQDDERFVLIGVRHSVQCFVLEGVHSASEVGVLAW
jgi:hypothetical protein